MKKSTTKMSLVASIAALVLCCAMLIGTTFAWFTDTASTAVNSIQAGKLDIALEMKVNNEWENAEGKTLSWVKATGGEDEAVLWEPGCTYRLPELRIVNNGNLALKYKIRISGIVGDAELLEVISFTYGDDIDIEAEVSLAPHQTTEGFIIEGHMSESAGNEYQGLSIEGIAITAVATQDTVEHDSYDNQYDAGAHPDAVFGDEIVDQLNDPEVTLVVAGEDIDMGEVTFQTNPWGNAQFNIPDGKTLDLNGNSIVRPDGGSGSGFKFSDGVTATITNGYVINEGDMTAIDIEYGATATFEKVIFMGHGDDAIRVRASGSGGKATAIFKNCTFENAGVVVKGMNGASNVDIQFIDCTFTGTYRMYDEEGNVLTDPHGHIHYTNKLVDAESNYLYGNLSFDGCTFNYDAHEASSKRSAIALYGCYQGDYPGKTLNVTLKDVTIITKNAKPVSVDSRYVSGLNIVETGTNSYIVDGTPVNYLGN